jgi:uncharacterized protein
VLDDPRPRAYHARPGRCPPPWPGRIPLTHPPASPLRTYARFILKYRRTAAAAVLLLLAASLWAVPRVQLDLSIIPILEANEAAKARVDDFRQVFPDDPVDITCVLEWPRPVTLDDFELVRDVERAFTDLPGVAGVRSLASTRIVRVSPAGIPQGVDFASTVGHEGVHATARRHPLLDGRLISRDGRSLLVLVAMDAPLHDPRRSEILNALRDAAARTVPDPVSTRFLGGEVVEQTMSRTIRRDMAQSVILESIFFALFLPLMFRTLRGMLIPLLAINAALALNFGAMVALGLAISSLGVAIPGLIVIIGLSDAIHLMYRFEEAYAHHHDRDRAIVDMLDHVGLACFYTSLTTALGFLSLLAAGHTAVREFALTATLGVVAAFIGVITILPLLLAFWPVRSPGRSGHAIVRLGYGRRALTLALFALGLLVALAGARRIVVDADWLGELPETDPAVEAFRWYEANFSGLLSLEVWIRGDLDDPAVFDQVRRLEDAMIARDGITGAESYADWVAEMLGNPPDLDDAAVARGIAFLKRAGPAFPAHVLTPDFTQGRIAFQTRDVGIRRFLEISDELVDLARRIAPDVRAEVAGYSRMAYESSELVVKTLLTSLLLSLGSISIFIGLSYRSVRLGLIAALLNAIPIAAALGLTGWLGLKLRIGIVMVYCLGIGLAVDDTIHMLTRYLHERRVHPGRTVRHALEHTVRTTGVALLTTSVVLTAGALSYLPSAFQSISEVGILLTCIVIVALVADLFLLPILIERFAPHVGEDKSERPKAPD